MGSDGQKWCWKRLGEPLRIRVVSKIMKHARGSIMVWGCMSWEDVGELTIIEENFSNHYQNILHGSLTMSTSGGVDVSAWQWPKAYQQVSNQMAQQPCNHSTIMESTIPQHEIYWTPLEWKVVWRLWLRKYLPTRKMKFGRTCKRNGTSSRWNLYKSWWN